MLRRSRPGAAAAPGAVAVPCACRTRVWTAVPTERGATTRARAQGGDAEQAPCQRRLAVMARLLFPAYRDGSGDLPMRPVQRLGMATEFRYLWRDCPKDRATVRRPSAAVAVRTS